MVEHDPYADLLKFTSRSINLHLVVQLSFSSVSTLVLLVLYYFSYLSDCTLIPVSGQDGDVFFLQKPDFYAAFPKCNSKPNI